MWTVVLLVGRVLFMFLVFGVFLFFGWAGAVVVVVLRVPVVSLCLFECVVLSGFCFLDVGSLYVGCVRFIASGVGSCRGLLRVVGRGGCGILVVLFLSLILWDLRGGMAEGCVGWRFGGGQGCVVSVLRSSFRICLMLRSSSPVRTNRR